VPDTNPLGSSASASTFTTNSPIKPARLGTGATHEDSTHQPGQVMHPSQRMRGGTWSHSLCDCADVGICCTGLLCPCILYGRTQYRLAMKSQKKDPTNLLGYGMFNGRCTAMALLCGCQCNQPPSKSLATSKTKVGSLTCYCPQGSLPPSNTCESDVRMR
jgi:hypothetical protein